MLKKTLMVLAILLSGLLAPAAASAATYDSGASPGVHTTTVTPADTHCKDRVLCGRVWNQTTFYNVTAYHDWCTHGPCPGTRKLILHPGQHTPFLDDWDAFSIPCPAAGARDGAPLIWGKGMHRIHDGELAVITTMLCF